ncbi:metallophosphoesterase family protein [Catenisphaera adipataccumulans]|jgi:calcineurin-like phosphoesterase family protein|uniref:Calcineurin-like phosphoesterase family protein n=1 Tax=Catenisphaera adipataccumulans TaxID=700500 RepID=A0A7W8CXL8_9FIRM|nr:metallophosphoesterase [Catenisphaera adipataccumulans]MBB5183510.1 calcineurin-like phosphoesterase family protein [Catenisphaera adipataccumulans]
MRYYIADCHFFHSALNEKMDCRGFGSTEEMNDFMIRQWNSRVRKNDEVVIIGDFSWGNAQQTQSVLDQIKGQLILIRGNHDRFLEDKKFDASRFKVIADYKEMHDNKRKVVLCHYPIACYNGQYRRDDQGNPKTYMLHGHIHNTYDQVLLDQYQQYVSSQTHQRIQGGTEHIPCELINCFCMFSHYLPLTLDEWIKITQKRRIEK